MKNIALKSACAGAILLASYSCDEASSVLDAITEDSEVATGLKSALSVGIDTAATNLSKDGGYLNDAAVKIGMPEEAATAFSAVQALSKNETFSKLLNATNSSIPDENTFIKLFNSAAEDAAPKSVNIFKSAITKMTISDAESILFGADNAATSYLHDNTATQLQSAFHEPVTSSLNSVKVAGVTTTSAWTKFADYNNKLANVISDKTVKAGLTAAQLTGVITSNQYASVQSVQEVNNDLSDYITGKALDGLFTKVADQEYQIRTNVNARVNDVLKKVFGRLDTKKNS
ncbi:MAG: DUF4197 domain-containing protein [Paludibacteraceae bacterium]|nr:DUF4197 domain-containing protein [Paludibacteraceae bacterium]